MIWAYKWLPVICGCHCRDDRSFYFRGRKFPVCARCTGMLAGWVAGCATYFFTRIPLRWLVVMILPLIIDGTAQQLTKYDSRNTRRLVTGVLFGYGTMGVFLCSVAAAYMTGVKIGNAIL